MRRRVVEAPEPIPTKDETVTIPHDATNEAIVLAAVVVDEDVRKKLFKRLVADHFIASEHRNAWNALGEMHRRALVYDQTTVESLAGRQVAMYLEELRKLRPEVPENLDWHVATLLWDAARVRAAKNSVPAFLDALRDSKADPEKVRSLARAVGQAFDGHEDRKHLRDASHLAADVMRDIDERIAGRAFYPYGIRGLDFYEAGAKEMSTGKSLAGMRRMVPGAAPGQVTVITGNSGVGKALALDTPIPTPRGWTTMGAISVGDEVFDENGEVCHVTHATDVMHGRDCFELRFSDGTSVVADADHLWKTSTMKERLAEVRRTEAWREKRRQKRGYQTRDIRKQTSMLARHSHPIQTFGIRTTREIVQTLDDSRLGKNHCIEICKPLQLDEQELLIPPYTLGAWLGDGTSAAGQITNIDEEIIDEIRDDGYEVVKSKSAKYRWGIYGLLVQLRQIGVLSNKHIPQHYMRGTIRQRVELLRGLMDTDGTCTMWGLCQFSNSNKRLIDDVAELLCTLGIQPHISSKKAKLYGRVIGDTYNISFTTPIRVFGLTRKAARQVQPGRDTYKRRYIVSAKQVQSVPVRCIGVSSPSHMFLATKSMIPTHNSTFTLNVVLGLIESGRKVLYGAWEMGPKISLELMTCLSLGWSRTQLREGTGPIQTEEGKAQFRAKLHELEGRVRILENPFKRRGGEKPNNMRHLDILQGYISDAGCDVFIGDLWKRSIVADDPAAEEEALVRQQAMAEEEQVHCILLQQQRLKDMENRQDTRPTREGIKGSAAWVEVADTILGVHRAGAMGQATDDKLEILVLKQRFGPWPMGIEFDWDAERGLISGGRTFAYTRGDASPVDTQVARGRFPKGGKN